MPSRKNADVIALDKRQQRKVSKQTKQIKKKLADGNITIKAKLREKKLKSEHYRGLVYIGHLPHGFYEEEMRDYFKQFGKVTNVKVCRSRVSGNSKGFGYVEFENAEVAKIAADTMNNYVMFKKRIITEYVPYEKRPKGLFYGKCSTKQNTSVKSRRGKQKFTRNKILEEETVVKKQRKCMKKFNSKIQKLNELGIQCNIKPVGVDKSLLGGVKDKKSQTPYPVKTDVDSELQFRTTRSKQNKSHNALSEQSKNSSNSSNLSKPKSNKAMLTKSLDSVKALISNKILIGQDEGTQTLHPQEVNKVLKKSKSEKTSKSKVIKKPKKTLQLNKNAVKQIARELIRTRGNPLLNLLPSKTKKRNKKN